MGRAGEATGTHTAATLRCTQAPLHQWQFTRGRNRHTHPQTVMKRELEKHPTEQMKQEEGQATAFATGSVCYSLQQLWGFVVRNRERAIATAAIIILLK